MAKLAMHAIFVFEIKHKFSGEPSEPGEPLKCFMSLVNVAYLVNQKMLPFIGEPSVPGEPTICFRSLVNLAYIVNQ